MESARVSVRLRPRGRKDELLGVQEGVVQARVTAPPVDGKANRALCRLIAEQLGVPRGRVTVLRGAKSRHKIIEVEGIGQAEVEEALGR